MRMGLLELLGRSKFMEFEVKILVHWPEGTEYLSNGPFFEEKK